jgi:hypothetical protein
MKWNTFSSLFWGCWEGFMLIIQCNDMENAKFHQKHEISTTFPEQFHEFPIFMLYARYFVEIQHEYLNEP